MITGPRRLFEQRVRSRGYAWQQVAPCIISDDGDQITVDETHAAYPHARPLPPPPPDGGPGTELKKLLAWFGITATGECPCNSRAAKMDSLGSQWVRDNLDTVVGWLEEEADKRGPIIRLAFSRIAAKAAVLRACQVADAQQARGPT